MKKFLSLVLAAIMLLSLLPGIVVAETTEYREAPSLAAKVAAGELPPLEERLPKDVFVEDHASSGETLEIGTYCESITVPTTSIGTWGISRYNYQTLVMYEMDGTRYMNVIKSYDVNEDHTVYTWHLREGLRWSDGEYFTADDITYWYYMTHLNNYSGRKSWQGLWTYADDGIEKEYADLEKIDDYTVAWTFKKPVYEDDHFTGDMKWAWVPSHFYIENGLMPSSYYQENPYWEDTGLSDEQVLANALAIGIEQNSVKDLGDQLVYRSWNYWQIPNLSAWCLTDQQGYNKKDDDLIILRRNPYFFKVDAEGNQLPYIDELRIQKYNDADQMKLAFISGDVDYYSPSQVEEIPELTEQLGDKIYMTTQASTQWGDLQWQFNYTISDPNYYALFNNKDFRHAMSIAIDRQYMADLLKNGFVEPMNCAPQDPNFGYNPEWSNYWAEYDPASAKALLEGTGLLKMGEDGYYDFADGTDLLIEFIAGTGDEDYKDKSFVMVQKYWSEIGIKTAFKITDAEGTLKAANDFMAYWVGGKQLKGFRIISVPALYMPNLEAVYACRWKFYYDDPEQFAGTEYEPGDDVKALVDVGMAWYDAAGDQAKRDEVELEFYRQTVENGWIGAVYEKQPVYYLVNAKLKNWFDNLDEDKYYYIGLCHPWCWYFAE